MRRVLSSLNPMIVLSSLREQFLENQNLFVWGCLRVRRGERASGAAVVAAAADDGAGVLMVQGRDKSSWFRALCDITGLFLSIDAFGTLQVALRCRRGFRGLWDQPIKNEGNYCVSLCDGNILLAYCLSGRYLNEVLQSGKVHQDFIIELQIFVNRGDGLDVMLMILHRCLVSVISRILKNALQVWVIQHPPRNLKIKGEGVAFIDERAVGALPNDCLRIIVVFGPSGDEFFPDGYVGILC
eukprot:scaffold39105_cov59-Cyclotella_meneghiniana.AAC.5